MCSLSAMALLTGFRTGMVMIQKSAPLSDRARGGVPRARQAAGQSSVLTRHRHAVALYLSSGWWCSPASGSSFPRRPDRQRRIANRETVCAATSGEAARVDTAFCRRGHYPTPGRTGGEALSAPSRASPLTQKRRDVDRGCSGDPGKAAPTTSQRRQGTGRMASRMTW